jgi:hypothetical protein
MSAMSKEPRVRLMIAGVLVELTSRFPLRTGPGKGEGQVERRGLRTFRSRSRRPPDLRVRVEVAHRVPAWRKGKRLFCAYVPHEARANWNLFRCGKGYCYESRLVGREYLVRYDPGRKQAHAVLVVPRGAPCTWAPYELVYYFLEVYLLQYLAYHRRGFVIHGSAVSDTRAGGLVFSGRSGSGKSTLARWWYARKDAAVLNDERVFVIRGNTGYRMYSSPWFGEFGEYLSEPGRFCRSEKVGRLFFLRRARRAHRMRALSPARAWQMLSQNVMWPFWDGELVRAVTELMQDFSSRVPSAVLEAAKRGTVVGFVRSRVGS